MTTEGTSATTSCTTMLNRLPPNSSLKCASELLKASHSPGVETCSLPQRKAPLEKEPESTTMLVPMQPVSMCSCARVFLLICRLVHSRVTPDLFRALDTRRLMDLASFVASPTKNGWFGSPVRPHLTPWPLTKSRSSSGRFSDSRIRWISADSSGRKAPLSPGAIGRGEEEDSEIKGLKEGRGERPKTSCA